MGRAINLDGLDTPRQVWLGRQEDGFCVKFTNAEGEPTRLWLSGEAIEALTDLYKTELAHPAASPDEPAVYVATKPNSWAVVKDLHLR